VGTQVGFWTRDADLLQLHQARHLCYIVSECRGPNDYAALTRLCATLVGVAPLAGQLTLVVTLAIDCRLDLFQLRPAGTTIAESARVVYVGEQAASAAGGPLEQRDCALLPVEHPPQGRTVLLAVDPCGRCPREGNQPASSLLGQLREWLGEGVTVVEVSRFAGSVPYELAAVLQTVLESSATAATAKAGADGTASLPGPRMLLESCLLEEGTAHQQPLLTALDQLHATYPSLAVELASTTDCPLVERAPIRFTLPGHPVSLGQELLTGFPTLRATNLTLCSSPALALTAAALGVPAMLVSRAGSEAESAVATPAAPSGPLGYCLEVRNPSAESLTTNALSLLSGEAGAPARSRATLQLSAQANELSRGLATYVVDWLIGDLRERQRTTMSSLVELQTRLSDLHLEYDGLLSVVGAHADADTLLAELNIYRTALRYQLVDRLHGLLTRSGPVQLTAELAAHKLARSLKKPRGAS
jgi:hypothetical protein